MTAEALAGALRLPLFVIRLEALITRFMGETAAKLRLAFDETAKRRGVYLFDEFDAVGGHRSASNDVAEMRMGPEPRSCNSWKSRTRRQLDRLRDQPPRSTRSRIAATVRSRPAVRDADRRRDPPDHQGLSATDEYPNLAWKRIVDAGRGLSQSELSRAAEKAVKTAILDERDRLTTMDVVGVLDERREMREAFTGAQGST